MTSAMARQIVYERPKLYPLQRLAFFCPERLSVCEASTKSGKSVGAMAWLLEQAMFGRPEWSYWWVAPSRHQSEVIFDRLVRLLPRSLRKTNLTHLKLTLANQSALQFLSGDTPDLLYGDDVGAAVIDEASRLREAAWHAVRSTLTATRGPIRLIGNVKGRKNWFYRLARRAEAGEPDVRYTRITATDAVAAGVLDQAEIDAARSVLPEHVFRELYLAEASEDGSNPFGSVHIEGCLVSGLSARPPVVWGWDLAKSVDWTVGIALDDRGAVCRFERFQRPWEETFRAIADLIGSTRAVVDSTGVGDPVVERLQRLAHVHVEGVHFTQPAKQQLMEGLAVAIQTRTVRFPRGPITAELDSFEYQYSRLGVRYSAPEGAHDDCVMALALATKDLARAPFTEQDRMSVLEAMMRSAPEDNDDA